MEGSVFVTSFAAFLDSGQGGLGLFPYHHPVFLCLQAPQSDPPSWTPRGYSSNSCFEVLYNGSKREALLYPLEGKLEGGVLLDVCSCKASAPKASSAADGGGGGGLCLCLFSSPFPSHEATPDWGWTPLLCGDLGRGGGGGVPRRDVVPALSCALAAGTVLQWVIRILEYCFCCPGKAGNPTRAHPPGKS